MRLCTECYTRTMVRDIRPEGVYYVCPCGAEEAGGSESRLIEGGLAAVVAAGQKYHNIITNAPLSRVGLSVARECPKCHLPYMTQVRVGASEAIVYSCKCGHQETDNKT